MPEDSREERVGLCARCQHVKLIHSDRGSVFYQCSRAMTDPTYARYPILPKLECRGFEEKERLPERS
jgi:hypothetical protein